MKGKAGRESERKRRAQEARKREHKKAGGGNLPLGTRRWQADKRNTSKTQSEESEAKETREKYPRVRRGIVLLLSGILSVIFGAPILWEILSADPIVRPPAESLDSSDPFAAPFTITNKLYFHTLYSAQLSCYFDKRSAVVSNIEVVREADVGTLLPGRTVSYVCTAGVFTPPNIFARPGVSIVVRVQYEIRILGLFSRQGEIEVPFPLREGPKGEFHWVEGDYITRRGPEIWDVR